MYDDYMYLQESWFNVHVTHDPSKRNDLFDLTTHDLLSYAMEVHRLELGD